MDLNKNLEFTNLKKIGFGGGCHWCTEAVFQNLKGILKVEQGWIASSGTNNSFSEAVIVHFNKEEITTDILSEIHLSTHKSKALHSMRNKYRSAIYTFTKNQNTEIEIILKNLQPKFDNKIITQILPFEGFKSSRPEIQNYYTKNPEKPFCKIYIDPKLKLLLSEFSNYVKAEAIELGNQHK